MSASPSKSSVTTNHQPTRKKPATVSKSRNSVNKENPGRPLSHLKQRLPSEVIEYIGYCKEQALSRNSCIHANNSIIYHESSEKVRISMPFKSYNLSRSNSAPLIHMKKQKQPLTTQKKG